MPVPQAQQIKATYTWTHNLVAGTHTFALFRVPFAVVCPGIVFFFVNIVLLLRPFLRYIIVLFPTFNVVAFNNVPFRPYSSLHVAALKVRTVV